MRRDDRGALLLDGVRIVGVELDLGEPDTLAGLLVDREKEPPDEACLFEKALTLADLRLGQLPVVECDVTAGHVVDALGRLDIGLHELFWHRVVDPLEPVALRRGPRPLIDFCPIHCGEVELVQLHGKPGLCADRPREPVTGGHAVARFGDHHEAVALALERCEDLGEERTAEPTAPVLRLDRDLGPPDVRVLRVLEVPYADAVARELAVAVTRHEDHAPLPGRPRA